MCTIRNKEITKEYKKSLKKSGGQGYAWKIVIKDEMGKYFAPFRILHEYTVINEIPEAFLATAVYYRGFNDIISDGAFHCILTRQVARTILKSLNGDIDINTIMMKDKVLKIVKVVFNEKDVVAVGRNHPEDSKIWGLDLEKDNMVCVTKFKFAK